MTVAELSSVPARDTREILETFVKETNSQDPDEAFAPFLLHALKHPKEIEITGYEALRLRFLRVGIYGRTFLENLAFHSSKHCPDSTCDIWSEVAKKFLSDLEQEGPWEDRESRSSQEAAD